VSRAFLRAIGSARGGRWRFLGPILLGCIAAGVPALAQQTAEPVSMIVQASTVDLDLGRQTVEAQGQARVSYGETELYADQVSADRASGDVQGRGNLVLVQRGRRLQGDRVQLNLRSEVGSLENARVQEQGVIIRGERIEFSRQSLVAHHAYFTTCDKPNPDYSLGAETITLTAQQTAKGKEAGRLTLDRARVTYHNRRLFTLPRYSISVGQIGDPSSTPFPVSGFDRDDGPYASLAYSLGRPGDPTVADLAYRYTSFRGIRGYAKLRRSLGGLDLGAGYVRREAPTDRLLRPDDFTTTLAPVLVNRAPELSASLADVPLAGPLHLRSEAARGSYAETEHFKVDFRARANRTSVSNLLSLVPYRVSPSVSLNHAVGWRRSSYSTGDEFRIRFARQSIDVAAGRDVQVGLSYITRRGSGSTPFLFDRIEVGRELLGDIRVRLSPRWRVRVVDLYDLERRDTRDMLVWLTRTAHCLDYTVGWRKAEGSFFVGISLARPTEGS